MDEKELDKEALQRKVKEEEEELAALESELAELDSELGNYLKSEGDETSLEEKTRPSHKLSSHPGAIEAAVNELILKSLKPLEERVVNIETKIMEFEQKEATSPVMKLIDLLKTQNAKIRELETRLQQLEK